MSKPSPKAKKKFNGDEGRSFWEIECMITSLKSDPILWNKGWEKTLHKLSASKHVYHEMKKTYYKREDWHRIKIIRHRQDLRDRVVKAQGLVASMWDSMQGEGHFVKAWFLQDEKELRQHLLKGLQMACSEMELREDTRALCPEITITAMLKRKGQAFVGFVDAYRKAKRDVPEGKAYILPSEWWDKALDGVSLSSSGIADKGIFEILTLERNFFIAKFIRHSVLSVLHGLTPGTGGMERVKGFIGARGTMADDWLRGLSELRQKPVLRCENCAKGQEDEGMAGKKFMQCGSCKAKLNFAVHYCSRECQKEDWPQHKPHCGEKKVSKKLPGTAQDPFWACPDAPEYIRRIPITPDNTVDVAAIGFADPLVSSTYSPALRRQLSYLERYPESDYFLFDDKDRPVEVKIKARFAKMGFRLMRSAVMSKCAERGELEGIAEILIKFMSPYPGLSREQIVDQLQREYGVENLENGLAYYAEEAKAKGHHGKTYLEAMDDLINKGIPLVSGKITVGALKQ